MTWLRVVDALQAPVGTSVTVKGWLRTRLESESQKQAAWRTDPSKSGIAGLTRLLANEWAPLGINVNAIAPGYMATENTRPLREDPVRNQAILERIPAGRWGSPEDLQGAAVFLASAASQYMQGYTIAVDGGWLAR